MEERFSVYRVLLLFSSTLLLELLGRVIHMFLDYPKIERFIQHQRWSCFFKIKRRKSRLEIPSHYLLPFESLSHLFSNFKCMKINTTIIAPKMRWTSLEILYTTGIVEFKLKNGIIGILLTRTTQNTPFNIFAIFFLLTSNCCLFIPSPPPSSRVKSCYNCTAMGIDFEPS